MNFWSLISTIILALGLGSAPVYNLPTIILEDNNTITFQEKVLEIDKVIPHKINNKSLGVKISAQSAAVLDKETGIILWQKNAEDQRSLASITKLMTALVFLENNPDWDAYITMKKEDKINGARDNILQGEVVKVRDLFFTSLIASDNTATRALVRSTGLEEKEFINLMNKKAKNLGLLNTKFIEVTGLNEENKSTALDILSLAKVAFNNQEIREVVSKNRYIFQTISGQEHKIYSTNQLLSSYLNVLAGKTGFIEAAGYGLVAEIASEDNHQILSVVLGSENNSARFQDLKILSAWTLDNYSWF